MSLHVELLIFLNSETLEMLPVDDLPKSSGAFPLEM